MTRTLEGYVYEGDVPGTTATETITDKGDTSTLIDGLSADTEYHALLRLSTWGGSLESREITFVTNETWSGGGENEPPKAYIDSIDPDDVEEGDSVSFRGHGTDSDGEVVSYLWNFGDGKTSTAVNPVHTFINRSTRKTKYFTVALTVKDNQGATSSSAQTTITVLPRRRRSPFGW